MNSMNEALTKALEHPIEDAPRTRPKVQHREGKVARSIEQQTAKIPSDAFLWSAVGAIGASLILRLSGKEHAANFVGQWAPTLLILGMYQQDGELHRLDGA
jgi:hypothetical protein